MSDEPTLEQELRNALIYLDPVDLARACARAFGEIPALRAAAREWARFYQDLVDDRFTLADRLKSRIRELEEQVPA